MLEFQINSTRSLVTITGSGTVTGQDFFEIQGRLRADPAFDASFTLLSDYRLVTDFLVSSAEVRRIASESPFDGSARRALVMPDVLSYGVARMFATYSEMAKNHDTVRIFHNDMAAATAWLASPPQE